MIAIIRIRAEVGPPAHDAEFIGPEQVLLNTIGPRVIGPRNIALFTRMYWMSRAYRPVPVGHQMEGFKIAQVVGAPYRRFFVGIVLATVVASVAGFWIFVANMYDAGAQNVSYNIGSEPFRRMKRWIQNPGEPSPEMLIEMGIGAAITVVLTFFHHRFLWFPFHPVGFAVAAGWVMSAAWFSIFVGWVVKRFVLFAGGPKMFRRAIPFFVGLVLGQHVIGGSWTILGMFTDRQVYRFFPYR